MALVAIGSVAGGALVAALARSSSWVPSIIASQPALGFVGAGEVAVVLYEQLCVDRIEQRHYLRHARASAPPGRSRGGIADGLGDPAGLLATVVVWPAARRGAPDDRGAVDGDRRRAADRGLRAGVRRTGRAAVAAMSWWRGLDVVIGYQVSWITDVRRLFALYQVGARQHGRGVGLTVTSAWMMPLGAIAARPAGTMIPAR
jgi:hypothetical protein